MFQESSYPMIKYSSDKISKEGILAKLELSKSLWKYFTFYGFLFIRRKQIERPERY